MSTLLICSIRKQSHMKSEEEVGALCTLGNRKVHVDFLLLPLSSMNIHISFRAPSLLSVEYIFLINKCSVLECRFRVGRVE